ncbi:phage tail spike protein [Staphylococcus haemolyticus]|uniref:phage tail spike protein n=1 Tax=Staphylococcus haemolyticus TaxID=1283 RepID=UPI0029025FA3|nr:phage tail spike protein [Staphylococcus haemolyticus]MDU0441526.1 phage tail spike protein [Staphylococcus haemolyticus]MDU0473644.1 phage tail spike protein [Staphylococcus haemolyticus]
MKNVGIHVLDFNDNIIDFISQSDGALINAEMSMNVEEKTETFDFTIENTRAEKLRERNRIIVQDNNGTFREFIIIHITDNFDGTTEIECNASYLEDLKTAKPIKPGKFEAHTTTQALLKTLADTGWEVSDDTEYGGNRTTSWSSHTNPFDLIYMLCTTYDMVPSFYIELGAHTVEHRYVSITKPKNLFKGKEITKGKDLTGMTRTIDLSEVKTALLAVGPEKEGGSRIETVVVDDEAQEIFGLPNRYIWDVYEPESNDENMTLKRLTTLAKTELNKRNQAAISYEVSSLDIHKYYNDVTVHLRDIVRVKDRDFRPPLYIEAEVIGIKYNWLADESEFTFGNVIEYEETKLREFFTRKLDEITKKLNDNISNVNTIVSDVVAGELEYYERKIFKGAEPPENPQNDTLWYDTSNPDVAVLRRYWNGKWITQTADDVEKIGGLRREQVMYRDLNNSFINLTIQHSRLQNDVYDMLNNEYLVDDDLKANLNQALSDVDSVYQNIKTNLDSMDEDTATIGKLIDTQTLFTTYRQKLQTLYKYVTDAKISIDKRLKLLQSQYTDEKFNDAMDKIAQTLPNGRWDSENQQLYADIPNEQELSNLKQTLQDYYDGNIKELEGRLNNSVDSKVKVAKEEISTSVKSVESKVDGLNIGTRNLLLNTEERSDSIINSTHAYITYFLTQPLEVGEDYTITSEVYTTSSEQSGKVSIRGYFPDNGLINVPIIDNKIKLTFKAKVPSERILLYKDIAGQSSNELDTTFKNTILVKGNKIGDYAQAPEDLQRQTQQAQQDAENAAKAYADAQDNLKETQLKAYADGKVSDEEKRAIADAIAKRDEAKEYAEQKAQEAQEAANQNTSNVIKPITTRVTKNETNISELDKQISLMAKSDDVAQKLKKVDNRLTPLETDVKRNKATLNILPTQIEGKVSKQDYTLDKNNIVKRLDNADSERRQLSNEITDKVTITKFESGMADAKNYTDNQVNNLSIGGRNLLADTSGPFTENSYLIKEFPIIDKLEPGDIVTISIKGDLGDNRTAFLIYNTNAMVKIGDLNNSDKNNNDVFIKTFEWVDERRDGSNKVDSSSLRIYQYPNSATSFSTIEWIKLEKGNKATDWTPANEDVKEDIQQAETNAKAYTDAYKKSNEVAMTKLETSVSQLDGKISIKVDEQKFNASRKTLSQVISEISATTKGINLSYDENGNIQSYTMDRNGIQLRGDKVDITVNKDFNVMANRVNDKVGKDEVINRLNLSPEGLDINVNKVGIRGGDSKTYLKLSQDTMELAGTFNRTWRGDIQKDNVYMRAQGGLLRFRNNTRDRSLYYSDFGISTYVDGNNEEASGSLQFFDYTYSNARGVTLNSSNGVAAVTSDNNRVILDAHYTVNIESNYSIYFRPNRDTRIGNNEFAMYVKQNDSGANTDGVIKYGNVSSDTSQYGSGIRFSKSSVDSVIYATNKDGDIGTGDFYGNKIYGALTAKKTNAYVLVEDALRITDGKGYNDGKINYRDIQCHDIQAESIRINSNDNFYVGVSTGELRVTNNLKYNGGNTGYKPVRASDFIKASSAEFKHDIKKWDYDALSVISNELQLYSYKYNDDEKETIHHGPVIGDGYDIPVEFVFNSGVNTNEMLSWALRAIQQLNEKINTLEEQLNE